MRRKVKKIGTEISLDEKEYFESAYKTANFGAARAIKSWIHLRTVYLAQLKGFFTAAELDHLLKIFKGTAFEASQAVFGRNIEFRLGLFPYDNDLRTKIKALEYGQSLMLCDWIDCVLTALVIDPEKAEHLKEELYP